MEELVLSLLENSLAGYELTVDRASSQSESHFKRILSDLTLINIQSGNSVKYNFTGANFDITTQKIGA